MPEIHLMRPIVVYFDYAALRSALHLRLFRVRRKRLWQANL